MENETEAHELLRAYGDASAPAPARKDAAWAALSGAVGAPGGRPAPAPSGTSWIVKAAGAVAVLGCVGIAAWAGLGDRAGEGTSRSAPTTSPASTRTTDAPPTETTAPPVIVRSAVPEPEALPEAPSVEPALLAPAVSPSSETEPPSGPPIDVSGAQPVPPATGTLAEELAVLRGAQRALRDGDAATALRGLDDHRARFPVGALARDRDTARVAALCALDRDAEATSLAAELDATGTSPTIARALSRCVTGP